MTENFLWHCIRNNTSITFGSRDRCKASWWMSIAFATLPPRMPLLLMKLAGDHGRVDPAQCWSWSLRWWLQWKIPVWLHSSTDCCPTSNSIPWRLWLFFLRGNCKCQCDRWWRRCYFTTPYFCMHRHCTKFVCAAKQQRQPCCFTYSSWERVDALCLQTFLVLTDKRGRSIWVW